MTVLGQRATRHEPLLPPLLPVSKSGVLGRTNDRVQRGQRVELGGLLRSSKRVTERRRIDLIGPAKPLSPVLAPVLSPVLGIAAKGAGERIDARMNGRQLVAQISCAAVGSFGPVRIPCGLGYRSGNFYKVSVNEVTFEDVHGLDFSPIPSLRPVVALKRIVVGVRNGKQVLVAQAEAYQRQAHVWSGLKAAAAAMGVVTAIGGVAASFNGHFIAGGLIMLIGFLWGVAAIISHSKGGALGEDLAILRRHCAVLEGLIGTADIVNSIKDPGKRNDAKERLLQQAFNIEIPTDVMSRDEASTSAGQHKDASPFRAGLTFPDAPKPLT